jgi:hypothetical protein
MLTKPTVVGTALLLSCAVVLPLSGQQKARATADQLARKMETAVSGATKVTSLRLEGGIRSNVDTRTGMVRPDPEPVEMRVLFPGHYLRTVQGWDGMLREEGFGGLVPLHASTPVKPGLVVTSSFSQIGPGYLVWQRGVAARLLVGMTGRLDGPLSLQIDPVVADSTLHVTGPDNFDARIDVAPDTGMPLRVRYEGSVFFYTPPAEGQRQAAQRVDKAELTLGFADRRPIDGVLVPHHITLTARSLTTGQSYVQEELKFERVQVNPSLTRADFQRK